MVKKTNFTSALVMLLPLLLVYAVIIPAVTSFSWAFILMGIFSLSQGNVDEATRHVMVGMTMGVAKYTFIVGSVYGVTFTVCETYSVAMKSESTVLGKIDSPTHGLKRVLEHALVLFEGVGSSHKVT